MYMEKSPHISNSGRKWKGKLLHTAGIKDCRGHLLHTSEMEMERVMVHKRLQIDMEKGTFFTI